MADFIALVLVIGGLYLLLAAPRLGFLSVISLFVYTQLIMAVGILPTLVLSNEADAMHCAVVVGTFSVIVIVASIVGAFVPRASLPRPRRIDFRYPVRATWALLILSIAICIAYYWSIGYFAFFESIRALVSGSTEDIADLRLQSYAGSRYLFPGYVNQFKNSLLPALVFVVVASAFKLRDRFRHLMFWTLIPLTLLFLMGTGQRAPFVRAFIFLLIAAALASPALMRKLAIPIGLGGLTIFFAGTFATGRVARELAQANGFESVITVFLEQVIQRAFGSSQVAASIGFEYVYHNRVPFGSEWWESLEGLLPGQPAPGTANLIFSLIFGSTRGTAPLSLWGSAYYNFGFGFTILVAALIALMLALIAVKANRADTLNLLQIVGIAGVTISFGLWISEGPTTPLNWGLAVYVLLWWWGGRVAARDPGWVAEEPPTSTARAPRRRPSPALAHR